MPSARCISARASPETRRCPRARPARRRPGAAGRARGRAAGRACWSRTAARAAWRAPARRSAPSPACSATADDLRLELVVVDALPDQSPSLGLLGRQRLGQHGEAARARRADQARQHPGAAGVGDEADPGEGLQEAGAAGGVDEVAGERDVGGGAGGDAVDRRDDRLLQRGDLLDQRIVGLSSRLPASRARRLRRRVSARS